jgi:hypothetical protein
MGFTMADCKPRGFERKTSGLIVVPISRQPRKNLTFGAF